jgi:type I restriction enzyme M protein
MAKTPKQASNTKNNGNSANLGFEAKLWAAADALRNNMDAAESPASCA